MIITHKGDGTTTQFNMPPHVGTVTVTVNGDPVTISSQDFYSVTLESAPVAGALVEIDVPNTPGDSIRVRSEVNTQAGGAKTYGLPGSTKVSVYVAPESGATGTVAITYRPRGAGSSINLVDSTNTQVSFNLASPGQPYVFEGDVESITFTPTSVTAGYRALITSWS